MTLIKDNIVNGAIIGTAGMAVQSLYSCAIKALGYPGLIYADYGRVLLFANLQPGATGYGLGLIAHWIWDIMIGVVFVYLIQGSSKHYRFAKGIIYSVAIWFIIQAGETLFRIPVIHEYYPGSEPYIFTGALLFGLVLAYTFGLLQKSQESSFPRSDPPV
jgi:hypothetical protein